MSTHRSTELVLSAYALLGVVGLVALVYLLTAWQFVSPPAPTPRSVLAVRLAPLAKVTLAPIAPKATAPAATKTAPPAAAPVKAP